MSTPYHAPARASFREKLGPGGAVSLALATLSALGGLLLPVLYRLREVLRGAAGDEPRPADAIAEKRAEARMKGYVGEACGECANFTLVRNGTCLKCDTCGSTTGCS